MPIKKIFKKLGTRLFDASIASSLNTELSTVWSQNNHQLRNVQLLKKVCRQINEIFKRYSKLRAKPTPVHSADSK